MIITFMGTPSAGKSYLARKVAEHYGLEQYSVGDMRREAAAERGMTIAEFNKLGETEDTDTIFDEKQKELAKGDDFVIDGRLSAHFIPRAIKVFVDASEDVRAKRMFIDKKRVGESAHSIEDAKKSMRERCESDSRRYLRLYGFDPFKQGEYDIVFDTTNLSKEESVNELIKLIDKRNI